MERQPCFTVFTPTFNRAHTLHRVYESLSAQTFRDFEWLVIDDGSSDGTSALVERWRGEASFPVRYFHQPNSGKHVAFNRGVAEARGRLFLVLDSDDGCVPRALERFLWHWESIPAESRDGFTGVSALCVDQWGRQVGSKFPNDVTDSDSREIRYRHRVRGEKWGFHRTEILRCHPFPELPGAKFVPEDVVWFAIARRWKTRYVNEALRIYWIEEREGARLSTTRLSRPTMSGLAMLYGSILNHDLGWFAWAPLRLLRSAVNYSRFSFGCGTGVLGQRRQLCREARFLWLALLPVGFAASVRDRARVAAGR